MIRIPQHRSDAKLNDLRSFIIDLEAFQREVDYWRVRIQDCIAESSLVLEELTAQTAKLSHKGFENMCYCIQQTVDGVFEGIVDDKVVVKLVAVDSTYWEISAPIELERQILAKYGEYRG